MSSQKPPRVILVVGAFCDWCSSLTATDLPSRPQLCPVMWTLWPSQPDAHAELACICCPHTRQSSTGEKAALDKLSTWCLRLGRWTLLQGFTPLPCWHWQRSCGWTPGPNSYHPRPPGLPQPSLGPWLMPTSPFFSFPLKQIFTERVVWTRLNATF